MIGRINVKLDITMLHTKIVSFWSCGIRADVLHVSPSVWHIMTLSAWPVRTPWARLAEFIKRITIQCYTQNIKALDLTVSEKILMVSNCNSMGTIGDYIGVMFNSRDMRVQGFK